MRYMPPGTITRVYLEMKPTDLPGVFFTTDKDLVWLAYKRDCRSLQEHEDRLHWTDDAEEAEDRAKFFAGWDDPKCWSEAAPVMFDELY